MELRHFRYFIVLAEELHFTRAAERLGIAPPTLSVQIQQIEQRLGGPLFDRSNRRVRLTPAGVIFREEAERVLRCVDDAVLRGVRAARGELGHVSIGYVGSVTLLGLLQTSVAAFRERWPEITTTVREARMDTLPSDVAAGISDVVFVRGPVETPEAVQSAIIHRDSFCIALPVAHPLAAETGPIGSAMLARERFIVPEQESGTNEVGRRGGFLPQVVDRPGTLLQVLSQVALGTGVAIIPSILRETIAIEGVAYADIEPPQIGSNVSMLWKPSRERQSVRLFVEQVISRFGIETGAWSTPPQP